MPYSCDGCGGPLGRFLVSRISQYVIFLGDGRTMAEFPFLLCLFYPLPRI